MAKKKITTIEGLATATQNEFLGMNKRFDSMETAIAKLAATVERGFAQMNDQFAHVNARIDRIHSDISDLPVMREELHGLRQRVERLERKAGVR